MNSSPSLRGLRIATLIVGLSGLLLLGLALAFAYPSWQLLRHAERASGTVIGLPGSSSSSNTRRIEVEYAVGDDIYTITSSVASSPPALRMGQEVTVLYDPANPADGTMESFLELWFAPMLLGIFALADLFVLVVLRLVYGKWRAWA
jgi:hypothetical protein